MDEHTLELINECLPLVKEMHAIVSEQAIPVWIATPICIVALGLFGALWVYHKAEMKRKDDTTVELVGKLDDARKGERDALQDQINRNEGQFEKLAELKQAMDAMTEAIRQLGG